MSASIWVTNPSKTTETRFTMTWDLKDRIVLYLPSGEEIVWSIKNDKPVFETLDGKLCVRCNSRRLYAIDSISEQTLKIWQKRFFELEETMEVESEKVDVAKYAKLLAEGLISLDDFNLLTKQSSTAPAKDDALAHDIDPLYEEFIVALDACWPNLVQRNTDVFGRVSISGVPRELDRNFVSTKLKQEKSTFERSINTSRDLIDLALKFGQGIQINGLPTTAIGGYMQGAAGFPVLSKFFDKELRKGRRSEETNLIIQRYRDDIRRRQSKLKLFSQKIGWTDLDFF